MAHHYDHDDPRRADAARRIQRFWRGRNRAKERYLTSEARWDEAIQTTQLQASNEQAAAPDSDPAPRASGAARARWRRVGVLTRRLQDGNNMLHDAGVDPPDAVRKQLETQHWLELIDGKHRYGSNLKYYFRRWKNEDTEENFFKWLDHGGGKDLDLKECPRSQLEKELITYLSTEQRLNYLVNIDSEGKLRWARNNHLVDTTAGHWKDAGHGQGIVPFDVSDAPEPAPPDAATDSPSSLRSVAMSDAAMHYVGPPKGNNKFTRAIWRHLTIHGLVDKLLRKTVQKNTWIYVSDKNFNMFIGIKVPGTFQHSSFLAGGIVTSAGLISVKDGVVHTLSPLSGHYRTSVDHFHQYIEVLEQRGVKMDKVHISKAVTALWAIEHIGKAKKAQGRVVQKMKKKAKGAAEELASVPSRLGDTNWKGEILEGRRRRSAEGSRKSQSEDPGGVPSAGPGRSQTDQDKEASPVAQGA